MESVQGIREEPYVLCVFFIEFGDEARSLF